MSSRKRDRCVIVITQQREKKMKSDMMISTYKMEKKNFTNVNKPRKSSSFLPYFKNKISLSGRLRKKIICNSQMFS
jgi:hypothetical protein